MKHSFFSFRMKLTLVILIAIAVPTLLTGYQMVGKAETAILKEKEEKLYSIARQLDSMLAGTYDDYLGSRNVELGREEKIQRLNEQLGPITDRIAAQNPGVGVGYYSKELNAVLTYGPSTELSDKIGVSIGADHPGNIVLQQGVPMVYTGKQVRGDIMNAMIPLFRDRQMIGYVWANEMTMDVDAQLWRMKRNIFLVLFLGTTIGLAVALRFANKLGGTIDQIIGSIEEIGHDLTYRLPVLKGVMGRIPLAINDLLDRLAETKRQTEMMEQQILRADRLKALGELAAGMAHEIRNPLTSIKAFSQIAEETMSEDDPHREYMEIIIKEVERMNGLVEQLLLFGKPSIKREEQVFLHEIMEQSLLLVDHDIRKKELKVGKCLNEVTIFADSSLVQQIMINLLLNAIQAVNQQGTLVIETKSDQRKAILSVFNSGSNIDDESREMIFNPFVTGKEKGMGLGLSVTQNIVHLYNGTIFFENINQGVKFQVEFPFGEGNEGWQKS
ncbi:MAG TPA: ATP-binding protein [Bacillota bacterium]|nr:ATP-binding protein [Bacillota bacterium]